MLKKLVFSCATLLLFFTGAEVCCRILRPDLRLFRDPYENQGVLFSMLQYDAAIGWTQRPGYDLKALGYPKERLNQRGLRGPEFPDEKPAGVVRIVAMGDSATFGIQLPDIINDIPTVVLDDAYPLLLQGMLSAFDSPGRTYQVINAGGIGYSTLQGLRYLRANVLNWDPDVVLIRYGWNDHLAREPNYRIRPEPRNAVLRWGYSQLLRSNLHAFIKRWVTHLMGSRADVQRPTTWPPPGGAPTQEQMRVSEEEFVFNLQLLVREARAHGVTPILMNAPAGVASEQLLKSKTLLRFLLLQGYASMEDTFRVHARYNALIAKVVREEGVAFLDLDGAIAARGRSSFFGPMEFAHPNAKANRLIAQMVVEKLISLGIVPSAETRGTTRVHQLQGRTARGAPMDRWPGSLARRYPRDRVFVSVVGGQASHGEASARGLSSGAARHRALRGGELALASREDSS